MQYWIVRGKPQENDFYKMLVPNKKGRWRTATPPKSLAPGHRLFIWSLSPDKLLIGFGELDSVAKQKNQQGDILFTVKYLTPVFETPISAEELYQNPVTSHASFLKNGPTQTVLSLTQEQGEALYRAATAKNPDYDIWEDIPLVHSLALLDRCIFHIVHTNRLTNIADKGGTGQLAIKGNWKGGQNLLLEAREQGKNLLIFFDAAEQFGGVHSAAIVTEIVITKLKDGKYESLVSIHRLTSLEEPFAHSDLQLASTGLNISPTHQRGYVLCCTPEDFSFVIPFEQTTGTDNEVEPDEKAIADLVKSEQQSLPAHEFAPENDADAREWVARTIVRRQGQPQFRQELLAAYQNKCAVTGYDAPDALEAAHVKKYLGPHTNSVSNGLLLRADIHTLFDLNLLAVDTRDMTVVVSVALDNTIYKYLNGKKLHLPKDDKLHPNKKSLDEHRRKTGA